MTEPSKAAGTDGAAPTRVVPTRRSLGKQQPAYRALAAELREAIVQKRYAQGQRLPTENELAEMYGVGRQTARRAFQELVAEGLVYRRRHSGTFARPVSERYVRSFGTIDDLLAHSHFTEIEMREPLRDVVDELAAGRLELDTDSVCQLSYVRYDGKEPFAATEIFIPPAIKALLVDEPSLFAPTHRGMFNVIGLLESRWPGGVASVDQTISAVKTPADVASLIDSPEGAPALRIERLFRDKQGMPLELGVSIYNSERFTYELQTRRG
jgi:DNA-binding GntR family transcriptional regulator